MPSFLKRRNINKDLSKEMQIPSADGSVSMESPIKIPVRRMCISSLCVFVGIIAMVCVSWSVWPTYGNENVAQSIASYSQIFQNDPPLTKTIAYAISFVKCGDKQTNAAGLIDAAIVLRHSIWKISSQNPTSGSKYDYKMYAIVHRNAEKCSASLQELGFEIVVVDPPVKQSEIRGEYLNKYIHKEWCCGADEFIKLEAYSLRDEEIVVHLDIDFAFYKPLDHLFDAILYDKDSKEGQDARAALELERPGETLPDKIGAFITRDWAQVAPGKFPPGYQAGFIVARRDPSVREDLIEIIKEGNYTDGWGRGYGWSGSGHSGYVGARAMQGLVAYYYDFVRQNNAVELNQCRHNHMGMDILYRRGGLNFTPRYVKPEVIGGCRSGLDYCEDCMTTDFNKIYSVHYTMCRKPWQCMAKGAKGGKLEGQSGGTAIDLNIVNLDHCHDIVKEWHKLRSEVEEKLYKITGDDAIRDGQKGAYEKDLFMGHCSEDGNAGYLSIMSGKKEHLPRLNEMY